MKVRVALCQLMPSVGDVEVNKERIMSCLGSGDADVYVFPELFLTGYGADCSVLKDDVESAIRVISERCRETDTAAVVGSPRYTGDGVMNSLAFLSPDGDVWYDKAHLAKFGIYAENDFIDGQSPVIGHYHGIGFGMSVCYCIVFPDIVHGCSLAHQSQVLCSSGRATKDGQRVCLAC